jgi:hypothetical protein
VATINSVIKKQSIVSSKLAGQDLASGFGACLLVRLLGLLVASVIIPKSRERLRVFSDSRKIYPEQIVLGLSLTYCTDRCHLCGDALAEAQFIMFIFIHCEERVLSLLPRTRTLPLPSFVAESRYNHHRHPSALLVSGKGKEKSSFWDVGCCVTSL